MAEELTAASRTMLREEEMPREAVVIDTWDVVYDLKQDTFVLMLYWDEYGFSQKVPGASVGPLLTLFEAAERLGGRVMYDGHKGGLKLEFSGMHAR
jgi:hypothetical protein